MEHDAQHRSTNIARRDGQFARDPDDELAMLRHLIATNADLILDVINNAERPDASDTDDTAS